MTGAKLLGYTSSLTAMPGQTLTAHCHSPEAMAVRLVELGSDGTCLVGRGSVIDGDYQPGMPALAAAGSFMEVPAGLERPGDVHLEAWIWPTDPDRGELQVVLGWGTTHGLYLAADGHIEARWGHRTLRTLQPVQPRRWTKLEMHAQQGAIELRARTRDGFDFRSIPIGPAEVRQTSENMDIFGLAGVGAPGRQAHCFDGKIARPLVGDGKFVLACWAMQSAPSERFVPDTSGNNRHGMLHNHPQRGMTGPLWRGESTGWSEAPKEYDAIAFHRDDLSDAGWPETFRFTIPDDLPSGAYGFELRSAGERDVLPFFVVPASDAPKAPLAFVVPTFSYLAYANERHWWSNPGVEAIVGAPLDEIVGPMDRWGQQNALLSLYDYHSDGTGNAHASLLRPLVNVRPDYIHPLLRGPHQLSGDILVIEWLKAIGQPFDILTDHHVHEHGPAALSGYRAVMTGSHPEYVSSEILDAFETYLQSGGRIMNLGGNAFYFVTSIYPQEPHVIEVRRGASGTIPWQSEPGEWRQASTGEPSGLWRWRGRSAHALLCTGTSAVSFGPGQPFVRDRETLADPAFDWIFEGIGSDIIDAEGSLSGGAAGFEVDSIRYELGSPGNTIRLASAGDFGEMCFLACEDNIGTGPLATARCDLAYRELDSGGCVFSAPSISWTSCLAANNGQNAVATITRNVLRRFVAEPSGSKENTKMQGETQVAENEAILNCSAKQAFAAVVDPDAVKNWLAPPPYSMTSAQIDAREGGAYKHFVHGPDGDHLVQGQFTVFVPDSHIRMSWNYSGPNPAPKAHETLVDIYINEIDHKTTSMRIIHSGLGDQEEFQHYHLGWRECLKRLASLFI